MQDLTWRVVAVTGAGSGIGRALAGELAFQGARLALSDVDEAGLAETVAGLPSTTQVHAERVDVSDAAAVREHAAAVVDRFGQADVVINNAGIAHDGVGVADFDLGAFARVLSVNLWGVVHGTQAFLPHLVVRPEAAVVNVSSVFGLTGIARQSAYCTSKFGVRGFTDSLRMELAETAPHVQVVTVHPGGVSTAIARRSIPASSGNRSEEQRAADRERADRMLRRPPAKAARTIVAGLRRGRERVLIGPDARLLDTVARVAPAHYSRLLARPLARLGVSGTP